MASRARSDRLRNATAGRITRRGRLVRAAIAIAAVLPVARCQIDKLFESPGDDVAANPNAEPGVPARLLFTQQPANTEAGRRIEPPIEVTVVDAFNERVDDYEEDIALAIASNAGAGRINGRLEREADDGVARFDDVSIDRPGSGYTLAATAPDLPVAFSAAFNVTEPPVRFSVEVRAGDDQTDTIQATLPRAYVVRVRDRNGDPAPGVTVNWLPSGGGRVSHVTSVTDDRGEAATVHTLGPETGEQTVTASVQNMTGPPATFAADVRAGRARALVFTQHPTDTERRERIRPVVVVTARDRLGNTATDFESRVTITITPGTGHPRARLSGDRNENARDGVARFDDLRIDREAANYRLRAQAGELIVDSGPFRIR